MPAVPMAATVATASVSEVPRLQLSGAGTDEAGRSPTGGVHPRAATDPAAQDTDERQPPETPRPAGARRPPRGTPRVVTFAARLEEDIEDDGDEQVDEDSDVWPSLSPTQFYAIGTPGSARLAAGGAPAPVSSEEKEAEEEEESELLPDCLFPAATPCRGGGDTPAAWDWPLSRNEMNQCAALADRQALLAERQALQDQLQLIMGAKVQGGAGVNPCA